MCARISYLQILQTTFIIVNLRFKIKIKVVRHKKFKIRRSETLKYK